MSDTLVTNNHTHRAIDEIMDWFDFGKVAKVMEALDWSWYNTGEMGVPAEPDLRETARDLLWKAYSYGRYTDTYYTVGTGGFYATYYPEDQQFKLVFQVAQWENTG